MTRLITADVHSDYSEVAVFHVHNGKPICRTQATLPTTIKELKGFITELPGKHVMVIEESFMSCWLQRHLAPHLKEFISCEPRHNKLIFADPNKNDAVDPHSLATLYVTGNLRPVYHTDSIKRQAFKDNVLHYHDLTRQVTKIKNKISARFLQSGMCIRQRHYQERKRPQLLKKLPRGVPQSIFKDLFRMLDTTVELQQMAKTTIVRKAKQYKIINTFQQLPGVGIIVAATFFAIIDTPWRFKNIRKLWAYSGLAVGNRKSNKKWLSRKGLLPYGNRLLKNMAMRAATSTRICSWGNPFNEIYEHHVMKGSTPTAAKNSVARKIVAVMWGMWKNGNDFRPQLICVDK